MLTRLDTHFLKLARMQGDRSSFSHKKRGAVLAKENKIIATGVSSHLNERQIQAPHAGGEEERYVATVNAEIVAIGQAVRAGVQFQDATLYVSDAINWLTFKIVVVMGIKRIVHYGPLSNERIQHYAQELGVEVVPVG